jgi:diguanylate cyclase
MNIPQSMKFRFLAFGVLLIVIGTVFRLTLVVPFVQGQLREQVVAQQWSNAVYVARDIDRSVVARRALIGQLAGALPAALLAQSGALAAWAGERQRLNPLFNRGLRLLRADGTSLLTAGAAPDPREAAAFAGSVWFKAALAASAPVMSAPQRSPDGDPVIVMAAPVRDAGGRVLAVLAGVAALDAPGFLDRLQDGQGGAGSFLLISPLDKLFVGASESGMVLQPIPPPGANLLHDRAMAGYRGSGVTVSAKGVEEQVSFVSVPTPGWFLVARMPTAEAFQPIGLLRNFMMTNAVIMLAGLLVILLFVLPRLLRPLTEAAQAMRAMAAGQRELAPLPVRHQDEVGYLVLGFNNLVERLREKEMALVASEARLQFMAHHDPLTHLCNRAMLDDRLQQALARAEREGERFALLFFDLDGFKPINDAYGHPVGDAVLVEVAARLSHGRRALDTVARLGGDEFVILLTELEAPRQAAALVAEQCLAAICAPYVVDDTILTLSASVGVVWHRGQPISSSQLMSQADIAMYRAKRAGKNAICFFDDVEGRQDSAAA